MHPLLRWLLLPLAMLALAGPALADSGYPARPSGPVLDAANILSATDKAALETKLAAYDKATGRAIVVATVPSLNGQAIEDYSIHLAQGWGIGGKDSQEGILFLIAPSEHKMRIEVGYGLEAIVTDALSGRIIRDDVAPRFRAGDFAGGINAGVDALIAQMNRTPADQQAVNEAAKAADRDAARHGGGGLGVGIWVAFMLIFFVLPLLRRRNRFGRSYGGTPWPIFISGGGWGGGGGGGDSGGGGFGGFGGGGFGGGGASGSW